MWAESRWGPRRPACSAQQALWERSSHQGQKSPLPLALFLLFALTPGAGARARRVKPDCGPTPPCLLGTRPFCLPFLSPSLACCLLSAHCLALRPPPGVTMSSSITLALVAWAVGAGGEDQGGILGGRQWPGEGCAEASGELVGCDTLAIVLQSFSGIQAPPLVTGRTSWPVRPLDV